MQLTALCQRRVAYIPASSHPKHSNSSGSSSRGGGLADASPLGTSFRTFLASREKKPGASRGASSLDSSGLLPLHHAALSGRAFDDGIGAVLRAAPRALHTRDAVCRMYPFMLAALASREADGGVVNPMSPSSACSGVGRRGSTSLPASRRSSAANFSADEDDSSDEEEEDDGTSAEDEDEGGGHLGAAGRRARRAAAKRGGRADPGLSGVDAAFGLLRADPSLIQSAVAAAEAASSRPSARKKQRLSTPPGAPSAAAAARAVAAKEATSKPTPAAPTGLGLSVSGPLGKSLCDLLTE